MASIHVEAPTPRKPASQFSIHDEASLSTSSWQVQNTNGAKRDISSTQREAPMPLMTSKMANQQARVIPKSTTAKKVEDRSSSTDEPFSINELLLHLSKDTQGSLSTNLTDESGNAPSIPDSLDEPSSEHDDSEVTKLKRELEAANSRIARMDQELHQTRITKPTVEQALGPSDEADDNFHCVTEHLVTTEPSRVINFSSDIPFPQNGRDFSFDKSSTLSPVSYESFTDGQRDGVKTGAMPFMNPPFGTSRMFSASWDPLGPPTWSNQDGPYGFGTSRNQASAPQPHRSFQFRPDSFAGNPSMMLPGNNSFAFEGGFRRNHGQNSRPGSAMGQSFNNNHNTSWTSYSTGMSNTPAFSPPLTPMSYQSMNTGYQPRPNGTPLSPTALEFSANALSSGLSGFASSPWNPQPPSEGGSIYMAPMEPMNYRRLLDRNMSCNWKYIVDKIVCSNDQQASIFLQQKLKVSTPEQKFELVEAIIAQAYPLMINRFGNFLVQRCFEHGTPEQIVAIANAIRGNTLSLSMDAFGCHVVQKAFDVVPEDYKAIMVHELLRRIPETVIHRYACHVWQKLFELRWSDSPPQIMKYVNESLRGMWHEVALGETGSLVVQNIFENCLEEDKRPCINEVLANIDIISHGQFGNWCIQHICEHGTPPDKSRAIEHVLHFATEYSTDQFASKVVEKCLKIAGPDFTDRYLNRVCESRPNRPRMPLIDIAGDQYGNYLVQHILIHAAPQHREVVANHVRKHMVSLRGSKFGSRVAMLCCNPAYATRPGAPMGMHVASRFAPATNNMGRGTIGGPY